MNAFRSFCIQATGWGEVQMKTCKANASSFVFRWMPEVAVKYACNMYVFKGVACCLICPLCFQLHCQMVDQLCIEYEREVSQMSKDRPLFQGSGMTRSHEPVLCSLPRQVWEWTGGS